MRQRLFDRLRNEPTGLGRVWDAVFSVPEPLLDEDLRTARLIPARPSVFFQLPGRDDVQNRERRQPVPREGWFVDAQPVLEDARHDDAREFAEPDDGVLERLDDGRVEIVHLVEVSLRRQECRLLNDAFAHLLDVRRRHRARLAQNAKRPRDGRRRHGRRKRPRDG